MSDGSTSTTGFNWSVEGGGAVSVSGLYTAPSASQETPATITATKGGKTGIATVQSVFEPATIVTRGPITGKIGGSTTAFTTMFTATNSTFSDYEFLITPPSAGSFNSSGVFTLGDNSSGTVTVKATHKDYSEVTATTSFTGVVSKATVTGKSLTGKVGGDVILFADMFTSNKPASEFEYDLTPAGDVGEINTTTGALTLLDAPTDELISVKATHKTQTSVTATATITATPKLAGLVASTVSNTVVVGAPENPLATDSITITDSAQPGVVRFDGVPQGSVVGALAYDTEGTDVGLMEVDLTGQVLTITLSAPITSEDTKISIRTNPASTIFRTYVVKSGV